MKTRMKNGALVGIAFSAAFGLAEVAGAVPVTFSFGAITGNATNAGIGASQLSVTVDAAGVGMVSFLFTNVGMAPCSITDVYFYDGALLGISTINDDPPDVDFSAGASPGELPGSPMSWGSATIFSADSNTPNVALRGVNPGESLEIVFTLQAGMDVEDVIAAMNSAIDTGYTPGTGELIIGIHVQAFGDGQSSSFVTVPLPAPLMLGMAGLGLVGLGGLRRRFVSRKA